MNIGLGFGIFGNILYLILIAFTFWMIGDVAVSKMKKNAKWLWVAIIFFIPLIGALVYAIFKKKW